MRKPWFSIDGAPGDRTLDQQLKGLERLPELVRDNLVLDVGCAEGLISYWCAHMGARRVLGTDVRQEMIWAAQQRLLQAAGRVGFLQHDLDTPLPADIVLLQPDVVLALGVLHKLQDPETALARLAAAAGQWLVIRLPADEGPNVISRASGATANCTVELRRAGLQLAGVTLGHENEWIGWYHR